MAKCLECHQGEVDNAIRYYRDKVTDIVYQGYRQFCCDACETSYQDRMSRLYPDERFERFEPRPNSIIQPLPSTRNVDKKLLN